MKMRPAFLLPLLPVLVPASCNETGPTYSLSSDEAWAVFSGLAGLAKDADPGTTTHACLRGGTVSVSTTAETGEHGDSSRTLAWADGFSNRPNAG